MAGDDGEGPVSEVLRDMGVSEKALARAMEQGRVLRDRTRRTGDEYAAMINNRTGNRLGKVLRGSPERTNIRPHLDEMHARFPEHRFVQLHTHPRASSRSFSVQDAFVVAGEEQVIAMVVAGADGRWYVLVRERGTLVPHDEPEERRRLEEVFEVYRRVYNRLSPTYDERVAAKELTEDEARSRQTHEVWTEIAGPLGLRYFRSGR